MSEETVDVSCELGGPDHTATESQRRDGAAVGAGMEIVDSRCGGPSEIDGSTEVVDVVQCSAGEIDSSTEIVGVVQYVTSENELADNESMLDCMHEQSGHNSVAQTCTPLSSGQIWADLNEHVKELTQEAVLKLFVWTRAPPVLCAWRDGNMCLVDFSCISKDRNLVGVLSVHGLYLFVPDPPWNYLVQFPTVNRPTTSVTSHTMIVRVCTCVKDKKKTKDLEFNYAPSPDSEERQEIILTGVPEELRADTIRSYMGIYVTSPEVTFLMLEDDEEDCDGMESGEVRVTHSGLKQVLPRCVKVAPGTKALVKSTSQVPWDKMLLKCLGLGTGGIVFDKHIDKSTQQMNLKVHSYIFFTMRLAVKHSISSS